MRLGIKVWAVTPEIDESTTKHGEPFGASTKFNLPIATCGSFFFNSASPPITSSIQPSLISSSRRSATKQGFSPAPDRCPVFIENGLSGI